mmetsp:Transcript_30542/g.44604  ORF Transcript_30542/g.44604 Transcript_30542/m.44604 type:complete len:662 (+) Transcript_30542:190-2175(+)
MSDSNPIGATNTASGVKRNRELMRRDSTIMAHKSEGKEPVVVSSKEGEGWTTVSSHPGEGWSNGTIPQFMFPYTREGKVTLFSNQRRWIHTESSWTRIGGGSQYDAKHSESGSGEKLTTSLEDESRTVRSLIAQLCEKFYEQGGATGTSGGVSIRTGGPSENRPWRVFVAPSGIQKEDMIGEDVFELDMDMNVVKPPVTPNLRLSACTPIWYSVYRFRPRAKCVIHTHSMNAQMATLLDPTERSTCLRMTHLEMLKGVGGHAYDSVLDIPIIDNRPSEDMLVDQVEKALVKYPKCNAILVRRHGVFVWGDSWEQAKTQCESFDYLFETAIKMKSMGIDPAAVPKEGTYRVDDEGGEEKKEDSSRPVKRMRTEKKDSADATDGFNAEADLNNAADLEKDTKSIPLLPRNAKVLLLDIEGCTTAISFVKDVLFPFVLSNIDLYLAKRTSQELGPILKSLQEDIEKLEDGHDAKEESKKVTPVVPDCTPNDDLMKDMIKSVVKAMMKFDVKATGLKSLQGKMWKSGYASGELKGHIYSDFVPMLNWCKSNGVSVNIYSSGSIGAQKLLFKHTTDGDLTSFFNSHFDTTTGSKKEHKSYEKIAEDLGVKPGEIVFASDAEAELVAARKAGIGFPVMSVRPGNAPLTNVGKEFPIIYSLLQLCGSD